MRVRAGVVAGLLAAAVAGCGGSGECSVTPDLRQAPASCSLAPSTSVTVYARWCACSASTTCEAIPNFAGGLVQLEPKVSSCDASCDTNPASCEFTEVPCTFTTPASGSYTLYFGSSLGTTQVPLTIGGSDDSCGPT